MVSAKVTTFRPRSTRSPTTAVFDTAVSVGSITSVTANTALKSGSSQHGNARRAAGAPELRAALSPTSPVRALLLCPEKTPGLLFQGPPEPHRARHRPRSI